MDSSRIAEVKKLMHESRSFSFLLKTPRYKEIYDDILDYTKHLSVAFKERIYWYVNQLTEYPLCALPGCGKRSTKFLSISCGYKKYCSASCAAKSDECKQRHVDTCRKKYGVDNVAQSKHVQQKMQATSLARYGVVNIGASKANRENIRKTNLAKYGTANGHKKEDALKIGRNITQTRCTKFYDNVLAADDEVKPLFSAADYIQNSKKSEFMWHCSRCGNDFAGKVKCGKHVARCLNCYPYSESQPEQEVIDFIKSTCPQMLVKQHDRTILAPLEADMYIPEKKLAIEFDGLYWHSDEVLSKRCYHLMKTEACEKQGIRLVHVFENEWLQKQDIVKSRIRDLLGVHDKTVYARKCEVREVDSKASKQFQDDNHIQGAVNASVRLGLYCKDKLVSLMTFGKCRFDKKHEWELLRFCSKCGYHIPGAASKLLKHFEKAYKPKSLVSYADRRWSQGKLYRALGFKLDHVSPPNYWYWHDHTTLLESRVNFQKHKLANILEHFDPSKSEVQNMHDNGYHRIFDCGNLVFEKVY